MSMTGVTPRQPPRLAVLICFVILATGVNPAVAQQIADTTWAPPGLSPAWTRTEGPRVTIDSAHYNFHTVEGGGSLL